MRRGVARWVVAVLLAGGLAAPAWTAEPRPYTFSVVPQGPPEAMRALWLPIVERLGAATGLPLQLQLHAKAEDFQDDLAAGRIDLAHANPVQVIRAHRARRYRPLVRDAALIHGVMFVATDSPVVSVDALAGREVAYVGPWTVCTQSLTAYTRGIGVVPKYVGTAANAYKNVLLGLTPAGGVLDTSLGQAPPEVRSRLRVIYETPPFAPHAVIAHPRVRTEDAARLAEALVELARREGPALLDPVHLASPVPAVYARDYAPFERVLEEDPPEEAP